MYAKIFSIKNNLISPNPHQGVGGILSLGKKIHALTKKLFSGSLAIRVVTAGSTNAVEEEMVVFGKAFFLF